MEFLLLDFKLYDKILLPDHHSTLYLRSEDFLSFICKYRTWVSFKKLIKDFLNVNLLNPQLHEQTDPSVFFTSGLFSRFSCEAWGSYTEPGSLWLICITIQSPNKTLSCNTEENLPAQCALNSPHSEKKLKYLRMSQNISGSVRYFLS